MSKDDISERDGSGGTDKPFPTPEEIQRKLGDFLKSSFGTWTAS